MSEENHTIDTLFSEDEIAGRVTTLAAEIARSAARDLFVVIILKGSFVFAADLIRALERAGVKAQVDFITLSSYGSATISSGEVVLVRDIAEEVEGRDVLIVDDILESGRTLVFARDLLVKRDAASVQTCLLLDKSGKRTVAIEADFRGFEIGDQFVVGYGLDYAHHYRGLPYIGVLTR